MDNLQRANQLFIWTEQQQLSASQLEQTSHTVALQPDITDWLRYANRSLLFGAIILLSAALIFFFAHNWPLLHYLTKFTIAGAIIVLAGFVSVVNAPDSLWQRAALLACCIASGALLALIGQTYQTGADSWQLFASWAALITPLVLLSRSRACYLLWFIVLELVLWRYLDSHRLFWLFNPAQVLLSLTLGNLLLLLFCQFGLAKLGIDKPQPMRWLAALALLLPLTLGALLGVWEQRYQLNLACYLLLSAVMALYYFQLRRDVLIFALLLFSAIAVSTSALARLLQPDDNFFSLNALALFVIASSTLAALWLKKLMREA
jgi:uncharacterized membrane protein